MAQNSIRKELFAFSNTLSTEKLGMEWDGRLFKWNGHYHQKRRNQNIINNNPGMIHLCRLEEACCQRGKRGGTHFTPSLVCPQPATETMWSVSEGISGTSSTPPCDQSKQDKNHHSSSSPIGDWEDQCRKGGIESPFFSPFFGVTAADCAVCVLAHDLYLVVKCLYFTITRTSSPISINNISTVPHRSRVRYKFSLMYNAV